MERDMSLVMRGVTKRYGSTVALEGVDLHVGPAEVHALLGENGAGKSTLMNVLCGVVPADGGEILLRGRAFRPRSPAHAARSGLAMIHQELTLAPHLSVQANIMLGTERSRFGLLSERENRETARRALDRLDRSDLPLDAPVGNLGVGERQLVEIARALAGEARIIVMDEPTSSLSARDRSHLFDVIRSLREGGVSVVYISHFLEEVEEICDRFTVLRDGATVGSGAVAETGRAELIAMMVGRELDEIYPAWTARPGVVALAVRALSGISRPIRVSFELRRGEIFGLAGLVGAGRTETLRAIFGLDARSGGMLRVLGASGEDVPLGRGTAGRIRAGMGMISEDRKSEGLATSLGVAENIVMSAPGSVSTAGIIRRGAVRRAAERRIRELSIRSATPGLPVASLSGGNQQKVAIARLLHQDAEIFLLDEPTRGIDIASKAEIYRMMVKQAEAGRAILFVSSYLPELIGVCTRIGVMSRGALIEVRDTSDWTEHEIMAAATTGETDRAERETAA